MIGTGALTKRAKGVNCFICERFVTQVRGNWNHVYIPRRGTKSQTEQLLVE